MQHASQTRKKTETMTKTMMPITRFGFGDIFGDGGDELDVGECYGEGRDVMMRAVTVGVDNQPAWL